MKKSAILVLVGTGLLALTACSSSGGGMSPGGSAGGNLADYASLQALLAQIQNDTLTPEDTGSRTGSVSMTGAIGVDGLGEAGNLTLIGDLAMTANFDTDTAAGSATGFTLFNSDTEQVEADVTGTLPMSNGTISGTDFDANMNGTLSIGSGVYSGDYGMATVLDGRFYDDNGTLVVGGDVSATIDNPDNTTDTRQGGFAATE